MTPEQLNEIEARADQAAGHVANLCTKEERWRMSVPPKDTDSDLMLMQSLEKDVPELVAEVRRLRSRTQQLLTDLKTATDTQYSRNLVIMRLQKTLGMTNE